MHIIKFLAFISVGSLFLSCAKETPKPDPAVMPEQVLLTFADSTMAIGSADTITAKVLPENTTDKTLEWSSSDSGVVSVNVNGRIEALKAGVATITATTKSGRVTNAVAVRVDSDEQRVAGWFEYVRFPDRIFTLIEVFLSNSSNKSLSIKRVDVYGDNETLQAPQPNTFAKLVPAGSASKQVYLQDAYTDDVRWYYAIVYFEMNNRHYAIKIKNGSHETVRVEQINLGSETEWDGENTIEIP